MRNKSEFIEISEIEVQNIDGGVGPYAWAIAGGIGGTIIFLNGVYNAGKDFGKDFLYECIYG